MKQDSDDNEDFFVRMVNKLRCSLDNILACIDVSFCSFSSAISLFVHLRLCYCTDSTVSMNTPVIASTLL